MVDESNVKYVMLCVRVCVRVFVCDFKTYIFYTIIMKLCNETKLTSQVK